MTDLSAGPGAWGHKVNEPDTSGQYPDPEAIRRKRIAELEREIAELEAANAAATGWGAAVGARLEHIADNKAELSRLRNEQEPIDMYDIEIPFDPSAEYSPSPSPEPQDVREVLQFYEREWRGNMEGDGNTPGLARTWMEPTDALLDDVGAKARNALAAIAQSDAQPVRDEVAWLVEFKPSVLGVPAFYFIGDDLDEFMTTNATEALRFARKQDAEQFIEREGWTEAFASEHMWPSPIRRVVRWEYRWKNTDGEWSNWYDCDPAFKERYAANDLYEVRPLYTAPPRPDASGLIEAAETWKQIIALYDEHHGLNCPIGVDLPSWRRGANSGWDAAVKRVLDIIRSRAAARAKSSEKGGAR